MTARDAARPGRPGFSLLEVIVAVVILAVVLVGLASSGILASRQVRQSRSALEVWSVVQRTADSLTGLTPAQVDAGEDHSVHGYTVSWTVGDSIGGLARANIVVSNSGAGGDTIVVRLR